MKPILKDNYYQLFPEIEPYNSGYLKVSDRHDIYYEEVGNPDGPPLVLLHGGPGGGISKASRQFCESQWSLRLDIYYESPSALKRVSLAASLFTLQRCQFVVAVL